MQWIWDVEEGAFDRGGSPYTSQVHCLLSIPLPFTLLDINKVYFFTTLALVTYLDDPRSNPCTLLHDLIQARVTTGQPLVTQVTVTAGWASVLPPLYCCVICSPALLCASTA